MKKVPVSFQTCEAEAVVLQLERDVLSPQSNWYSTKLLGQVLPPVLNRYEVPLSPPGGPDGRLGIVGEAATVIFIMLLTTSGAGLLITTRYSKLPI